MHCVLHLIGAAITQSTKYRYLLEKILLLWKRIDASPPNEMSNFAWAIEWPNLLPKTPVSIQIWGTRFNIFCRIIEELINCFGWISAIFIGWPDQFVSSSTMTEGQIEDWTELASWERNSSCIRSSSQHEFSSSIRAQTRVLFGRFFWGEMMWLVCWFGNHLSFRIITDVPLPIFDLKPKITTRLAFRMLYQAYDPFSFTSSSKIEQLGKYLDLKTL